MLALHLTPLEMLGDICQESSVNIFFDNTIVTQFVCKPIKPLGSVHLYAKIRFFCDFQSLPFSYRLLFSHIG